MGKQKVGLQHEQMILGSMLRDKKERIKLCKTLRVEDFFHNNHRAIFAALQTMLEQCLEYTPGTLRSLVPVNMDFGGTEYLDKLESLGQEENIDYHVERMKWDKTRLQMVESELPDLEGTLKDPRETPETAIRIIKSLNDKLQTIKSQASVEGGESLGRRYSASICARKAGSAFRSSGFPPLDKKLVSGFGPGQVSVLTGAPSMGKTTFALNMVDRQRKTFKVGYLAWEGGTTNALDIICASRLQIPLETLIKYPHLLKEEDQKRIDEYIAEILGTENLSFLRLPPSDVLRGPPWEVNERVLDWFEGQLELWDRDIVYWDLFEKCLPNRKPEAISWALDRIQGIANRSNKHICLLHQITFKEVERRQERRPTRDSLKGSGGYVEVADLILGLYRTAIYNSGIEDNTIEVICLKQRRGPFPWKILFRWDGTIGKVSGGSEPILVIENDPVDDYENKL